MVVSFLGVLAPPLPLTTPPPPPPPPFSELHRQNAMTISDIRNINN